MFLILRHDVFSEFVVALEILLLKIQLQYISKIGIRDVSKTHGMPVWLWLHVTVCSVICNTVLDALTPGPAPISNVTKFHCSDGALSAMFALHQKSGFSWLYTAWLHVWLWLHVTVCS